jgi:hypothetical protein
MPTPAFRRRRCLPTRPPNQQPDPDPSADNPGYTFTFRQFPTFAAGSGATPAQPLAPSGTDPLLGFLFGFNTGSAGDNFFWIDPLVAVGYDYEITGSNVTSIVVPALPGDSSFGLSLFDGSNFVFDQTITGGVAHNFAPGGVSKFRVDAIDPGEALDPTDPLAFVTGMTFADPNATVQVAMLPLTFNTDPQPSEPPGPGPGEGPGPGPGEGPGPGPGDAGAVPEPSTMILLALGGAAALVRRRRDA